MTPCRLRTQSSRSLHCRKHVRVEPKQVLRVGVVLHLCEPCQVLSVVQNYDLVGRVGVAVIAVEPVCEALEIGSSTRGTMRCVRPIRFPGPIRRRAACWQRRRVAQTRWCWAPHERSCRRSARRRPVSCGQSGLRIPRPRRPPRPCRISVTKPLCDTYAGRVTREAAPQAFRANHQLSTTKE